MNNKQNKILSMVHGDEDPDPTKGINGVPIANWNQEMFAEEQAGISLAILCSVVVFKGIKGTKKTS